MIFDTHCHLNSEDLYEYADELIESARKKGVSAIMVPGYDYDSCLKVFELIKKNHIYGAIGLQPEEIFKTNFEDFFPLFAKAKSENKIKAIGEIGLDYYWEKDEKKREKQREIFIKQIQIANEMHLPIIVHSREAINDTYKILKEHKPLCGGIMHCYSGPAEMVKQFTDVGMYISLGGPVTFKNAKTPKEVAKIVSIDNLLVETDAPYLAPHPLRGTQNKPENIVLVLKIIEEIRQCPFEYICEQTYKNACKIFGIEYEEN